MMRMCFTKIALVFSFSLMQLACIASTSDEAKAEKLKVAVSPGVKSTLTDISPVLAKLAQDPESPFSFSSEAPPISLADAVLADFSTADVVIAFESEEPPALFQDVTFEPGRRVDVAYYVIDSVASSAAPSAPVVELGQQDLHAYPSDLSDFSRNVLTECLFLRRGKVQPKITIHEQFKRSAQLDPLIVKTFYKNRYLYYKSDLMKYFIFQQEVRAVPYDSMGNDISSCIIEKEHKPIEDIEILALLDEVDHDVERLIKFEKVEGSTLKAIGRFDEVRYYMKKAVKPNFVDTFFSFLYQKMEQKKVEFIDKDINEYAIDSSLESARKYAKVYELLSGKLRAILNSARINYGLRAEFYFKRINYGAIMERFNRERGRLTEAERADIDSAIRHYERYFLKLRELPKPKIELDRLYAYYHLTQLHYLLHNDAFVQGKQKESKKHLLECHRVIDELKRDIQIVDDRKYFPVEHEKLSGNLGFIDFKELILDIRLRKIRAIDAGV